MGDYSEIMKTKSKNKLSATSINRATVADAIYQVVPQ